jgi:hypothetical protein
VGGNRRVGFFLSAAVVALLLLPVSPPEFRIVCELVAGVYVVLALAMALDRRSRRLDLADHQRANDQRADDQRADESSSSAR